MTVVLVTVALLGVKIPLPPNHPVPQDVNLRHALHQRYAWHEGLHWRLVRARIAAHRAAVIAARTRRRVSETAAPGTPANPAPPPATTSTSGVTAALLCIHSHEGAWNDPNGPYWGGLQMDIAFMRAYGPEFYARYGTADHWPVADQLTAGARAVAVRGYSPWPNTAAMCGLS